MVHTICTDVMQLSMNAATASSLYRLLHEPWHVLLSWTGCRRRLYCAYARVYLVWGPVAVCKSYLTSSVRSDVTHFIVRLTQSMYTAGCQPGGTVLPLSGRVINLELSSGELSL